MPNLRALARLPLRILPRCTYDVFGPSPDSALVVASKFDARGYSIDNNNHVYKVDGLLTNVTERQLVLLPDGVEATGAMLFTTEESFNLPGHCTSDNLQRYVLHDKDGSKYTLMSRRRVGCVWQYVCELECKPEC